MIFDITMKSWDEAIIKSQMILLFCGSLLLHKRLIQFHKKVTNIRTIKNPNPLSIKFSISTIIVPSVFDSYHFSANDARWLAGGDNDLSAVHLSRKIGAPCGIQLRENVVKQKHRLFSRHACTHLSLGKLHGKRQ